MHYKHTWHHLHSLLRHNWQYLWFLNIIFRSFIFLPVHPYFYPSTTVFTRPNDGWMCLCIKLWLQDYVCSPRYERVDSFNGVRTLYRPLTEILEDLVCLKWIKYRATYFAPLFFIRNQKRHRKLLVASIWCQCHWKSGAELYVETRPPVIWTGKNQCGRVEIWVDRWTNEGAKKYG